jgi:hypothetical protein
LLAQRRIREDEATGERVNRPRETHDRSPPRVRDVFGEAEKVLLESALLREALQRGPGRRFPRLSAIEREAHFGLGRAANGDAPEKTTVEKRPEDFRA